MMYIIKYIKGTYMILSAAEFRTNMKDVLDAALKEPITIIRGTDIFVLQKGIVQTTPLPENTRYEKLREEKMAALKPAVKQFIENEKVVVDDLLKKSEATPRDVGDVLEEVRDVEAVRDEALRYNQDADNARTIKGTYQKRLDQLWAEYHMRKSHE